MRKEVADEFKALVEGRDTDLPTLLCEIIKLDNEIEEDLQRIKLLIEYKSPFVTSRKYNVSAAELIFMLNNEFIYKKLQLFTKNGDYVQKNTHKFIKIVT